ncbi:MAG: 5-(carboxyamino)imidazole ribonucleotide mutase [Deltaproteobacteria bacterium]|nr:MAG: 5-(carboxyamino)imidazole ribonucleotide mutase [Deltaproteobacteria bacterium]
MDPVVSIIMGSDSDWQTLRHAAAALNRANVPFERRVISAHRTPERMVEFAKHAEQRGLRVIIAGAGGAAHLPGMVASLTALPVLGVPVRSRALSGIDSLLSIVQMPGGVPTATFSIGESGAINAAIFAIRILALHDERLRAHLDELTAENAQKANLGDERVRADPLK